MLAPDEAFPVTLALACALTLAPDEAAAFTALHSMPSASTDDPDEADTLALVQVPKASRSDPEEALTVTAFAAILSARRLDPELV